MLFKFPDHSTVFNMDNVTVINPESSNRSSVIWVIRIDFISGKYVKIGEYDSKAEAKWAIEKIEIWKGGIFK